MKILRPTMVKTAIWAMRPYCVYPRPLGTSKKKKMGMSLGFYIVENKKIGKSISFTNRISTVLIQETKNDNLNILQRLVKICSHDS